MIMLISHGRGADITSANKRRQSNFTKSIVTINNTVYQEIIQNKTYAARSISPDHYQHLAIPSNLQLTG